MINWKYKTLEGDLFEILKKNTLKLMPDDLVKISCKLLVQMFGEYSSYQMMLIVGYGSIWAWSFDTLADDPQSAKEPKIALINSLKEMVEAQDLFAPIFL